MHVVFLLFVVLRQQQEYHGGDRLLTQQQKQRHQRDNNPKSGVVAADSCLSRVLRCRVLAINGTQLTSTGQHISHSYAQSLVGPTRLFTKLFYYGFPADEDWSLQLYLSLGTIIAASIKSTTAPLRI